MGTSSNDDPNTLTLPAMPSRNTLVAVLNAAAANDLGGLCIKHPEYSRVCRDEMVWKRLCWTTRCPPKPPLRQWLHHYVRSKRPAYGPCVDGALQTASRGGCTEDVHLLLAAGADVHVDDDELIGLASEDGYVDVVDALIVAGADVNASGGWPVKVATSAGHADVVHLLLLAGANPP